MSNYKGYLKGINPNNTRKLIMDEQSFAYEPATGTFVNEEKRKIVQSNFAYLGVQIRKWKRENT